MLLYGHFYNKQQAYCLSAIVLLVHVHQECERNNGHWNNIITPEALCCGLQACNVAMVKVKCDKLHLYSLRFRQLHVSPICDVLPVGLRLVTFSISSSFRFNSTKKPWNVAVQVFVPCRVVILTCLCLQVNRLYIYDKHYRAIKCCHGNLHAKDSANYTYAMQTEV